MSDVRKVTNAIIERCEEYGPEAWERVARECLTYMSEDDVADMNRVAEFVDMHDHAALGEDPQGCPDCRTDTDDADDGDDEDTALDY